MVIKLCIMHAYVNANLCVYKILTILFRFVMISSYMNVLKMTPCVANVTFLIQKDVIDIVFFLYLYLFYT